MATTYPEFPFTLGRDLEIRASPEVVFSHFTSSERWASWWGAGSSVDPTPGGRVVIRYPNGIEAGGEVLEIEPPLRFVFSFGYASGTPMALGESRVAIELEATATGFCRLRLRHHLADATIRDHHVQGWRYQLSVFAQLAAAALLPAITRSIESWNLAWSSDDAAVREAQIAAATVPDVRFRDRWSNVNGHAELLAQLGAIRQFMPGSRLEQVGAIRHTQGVSLVDWVVRGADNSEVAHGTNVVTNNAEGRLVEVVGVGGAG